MVYKACGAILAGGKSSRMKFNKAFAKINDKTVLEIIIDKFTSFFAETVIISNQPELFRNFGLKVFEDVYPYLGPVAGIHAALYYARFDPVFILSCDIPFIYMDMVAYMIERIDDHQAVAIEMDSYIHATAAAYSKRCLPVFQDCLENDKLKLTRIVQEMDTLILREDELRQFGNLSELLLNVNDPVTLKLAQEIAGRLRL